MSLRVTPTAATGHPLFHNLRDSRSLSGLGWRRAREPDKELTDLTPLQRMIGETSIMKKATNIRLHVQRPMGKVAKEQHF